MNLDIKRGADIGLDVVKEMYSSELAEREWVSVESLKEYIKLIDKGEKDINDLYKEIEE